MRKQILTTLLFIAALSAVTRPLLASKATKQEALKIAKAWVEGVVRCEGSWGKALTAEVAGVQDLKRKGHLVGYYCKVVPKGYVIISLYKELAAVKAYSETSDLNPASEEGMADLIKGRLERLMSAVESKTGRKLEKLSDQEIAKVLDINSAPTWDRLLGESAPSSAASDYSSGGTLMTTIWNQGWPYNDRCPWMDCSSDLHGRAWVGCVATAGCQTMRYWCWPPWSPNGAIDWADMPDELTGSSSQNQIDAVALFCHELGVSVDTDYGCDGSSANVDALVSSFIDSYHYSRPEFGMPIEEYAHRESRMDYSTQPDGEEAWFARIQYQLNLNRVIPYRVDGHAIVCDGWRILYGAQMYHMNYGHNNSESAWYYLDNLYLGGWGVEYMVSGVVPICALRGTAEGTLGCDPGMPYRYVDRDCTGNDAYFVTGQKLQFLPNVTLTCTSTSGGSIRWSGAAPLGYILFTRGDQTKGIFIHGSESSGYGNGSMRLYGGGGVILR